MSANLSRRDLIRLQALNRTLSLRISEQDPAYFFRNFIWVKAKDDEDGKVLFDPYDYQLEDLKLFQSCQKIIVLKTRQIGFSTLSTAYLLWLALFRKGGANIGMTSFRKDAVQNNLTKIKSAFDDLPDWVKETYHVAKSNESVFIIQNMRTGSASKIDAQIANDKALASETYDFIFLDEFGLSNEQESVIATVNPSLDIASTVDPSVKLLIGSTARGPHNQFAKLFMNTYSGEDKSYKAVFHPWYTAKQMTPELYELKKRSAVLSGEPWKFYSEYPETPEEAFRESGSPLFTNLPDVDSLEEFPYRGRIILKSGKPEFISDEYGPVRLKNFRPDESTVYVIGADTSSGEGADFQAAQVAYMDQGTGEPEIVAYYHANDVPGREFAVDLNALGRFFAGSSKLGAAELAVENQGGFGTTVIDSLTGELAYPNPYLHSPIGQNARPLKTRPFAFPMTVNVRESVLLHLKDMLKMQMVPEGYVPILGGLYPSLRNELSRFVRQAPNKSTGRVKYAADSGAHDDLVMSTAITLWVLKVVNEFSDDGAHKSSVVDSFIDEHNARYQERMYQQRQEFEESYYVL